MATRVKTKVKRKQASLRDEMYHDAKGKERSSRRGTQHDWDFDSETNGEDDTFKRILEGASIVGSMARSKFRSGITSPQKWSLAMEELEYANRQAAIFVGPRGALVRSIEIDDLEKSIRRVISVLELGDLILVFRPTALETAWVRITVPVEDRTDEESTKIIADFLDEYLDYEPEFFGLSRPAAARHKKLEQLLDIFIRLEPTDQATIISLANEEYNWHAVAVAEPTPMEIEQVVANHEYTLGRHMKMTTECIFLCGKNPMQVLDWIGHFLEDHVKLSDGLQPAVPLSCPWCDHKLMDWDHIATHIYAHLRLEDPESSWDEGWRRKAVWEYIHSVARILPIPIYMKALDYVAPPWPSSDPFWEWEDIQAILNDDGSALAEERIIGSLDLTGPNAVPDIVLELLSTRLRSSLSFRNASWTFFGDPLSNPHIPIAIANCPVIVPVLSPHPISDIKTIPPPDPHSDKLLNPRNILSEHTLRRLMDAFPFANAFYVLFNYMLQIWVDDNFDFHWAASALPRTFGGLIVSYFKNAPVLASGRSSRSSTFLSQRSHASNRTSTTLPSGSHSSRATPINPVPLIRCGREIEISSPRSRGLRSRSCLGVALEIQNPNNPSESEVVVTVSSHAVIAPNIRNSKRGILIREREQKEESNFWRKGLQRLLNIDSSDDESGFESTREERTHPRAIQQTSPAWWEDCHVYAAGTNTLIGTICSTYDPDISLHHPFPTNYNHDISLLRPLHIGPLSTLRSPANHWYPHRVVDSTSSIYLLGPHGPLSGTGIPRRWGSSVGTGYLVRQKRFSRRERSNIDINALIARCVLWRPLDAVQGWDTWSGAPVFVLEDGKHWLLGFMGFAQHVEHYRRFRREEDVKEACESGYVAFAACMMPPQELLGAKIL